MKFKVGDKFKLNGEPKIRYLIGRGYIEEFPKKKQLNKIYTIHSVGRSFGTPVPYYTNTGESFQSQQMKKIK